MGAVSFNASTSQALGLAGWWPCEMNGLVYDQCRSNHGIAQPGTTWVVANDGPCHALRFDGTNGFVSCGDVLNMRTGDFSFGCWFRVENGDNDFSLISKSFYGGASNRWFLVYEAGAWIAGLHASTNHVVQWTTTYGLDGLWHHVAITIDRDSFLRLYMDGIERSSGDISASSGWDVISTFHLFFGRYNDNVNGQNPHPSVLKLNGQMRDVRISRMVWPPALVWQMWAPQTRFDLFPLAA